MLRSLIDLLPNQDFYYFGDTGRFPYGNKSASEVRTYSIEIAQHLVDQGATSLVVGCNSASAVALDDLREKFDMPIVGVIDPAMRAALKVADRSHRIGVIGTVGTIASGAYQAAANRIDPELELICAACPGFVEFVEQGDVYSDEVHVLAERLLKPIVDASADALILGCTHYPLLARTIADVVGPEVVLVSSADETAFEVRSQIAEEPERETRHRFITSGDPNDFRKLGAMFLGPEVDTVESWVW